MTDRLAIEYWPLESVRAYERDPRVHPDSQVAELARSIQEFGFNVPLLVDRDGLLIAGRGRLAAARLAGLAEVPVIRVTDLADLRSRAFRLADNAIAERATWDRELLAEEIADLAAAGWDDADLITPEDYEPTVAETGEDGPGDDVVVGGVASAGRDDEDDAPEAPVVATTVLGDLWRLGGHRLLCGDATDAGDVARLLGCGLPPPVIMVTDPPYGVEYTAKWRHDVGLNNSKAIAEIQGDERADWREAWALFPGDVAYVWYADLKANIVANSLMAVDFDLRSQIIWAKSRFAISHGHYHHQHESCQPAGTMVMVPRGPRSDTALIPIEQLKDGDRVVSYGNNIIKRRGAKIKVASRHYDGPMHEVVAAGCVTKATHCHQWSVRLSSRPMWLTYLMRKGDRWRVGQVRSFNSRGFGPTIRLKDERGDSVWVLSAHASLTEAMVYEQAMSVKFGIPTTHWAVDPSVKEPGKHRTEAGITKLYELVGPLSAKAEKLLHEYGRHFDLPLATNEGVRGGKTFFSRQKLTVVRSCNLIPGLMELPKPTGNARASEPNGAGREGVEYVEVSSVSRHSFSGQVYSMSVACDKHYVADGLVTHNCWYSVRSGKTANWQGRRDQTTLWEVAPRRTTEDALGTHPTQKPVELYRRAMVNHTVPGDSVYDPFCGSGTVLIACETERRVALAIELAPEWCDASIQRWQRLTGEAAVLEATGESFDAVAAARSEAPRPAA